MFTSKLKALDSDDSNGIEDNDASGAPTITREALEQRTLLQYQEALQLEKSGQFNQSETILRSLLDSEILSDVNIGNMDFTKNNSFLHLKYCVAMNLGHCLIKQDKLEEGLDYYLKATSIEDSDLNLWYKIGTVAMKLPDLKLAASAFAEGLKRSPHHWGCIDKLVTVLFALGDFISCLYFIRKGVQMDNGFIKGHAFQKAIFYQSPFLRTDFTLFYPEYDFKDVKEVEVDESIESQLLSEAEALADKERQYWDAQHSHSTNLPLPPVKITSADTWYQLANNILLTHQMSYDKDPKLVIYQEVLFDQIETIKPEEPINTSSHSEASRESIKPEEENNDQGKGGTYEKWLSCQKRRSARVRSTVRKEEPSLARALAHLIPPHLLHRHSVNGLSEDSMETMDLYRLFESKESDEAKPYKKNSYSVEERRKKIVEENYFSSDKEIQDVLKFMLYAVLHKFTLLDCIKECILKLSVFWKLLWPHNLSKIFVQLFKLFMKYNPPNILVSKEDRTKEEYLSVLMYGELLLDRWLEKGKEKGKPSPLGKSVLGGEFPSLYLGMLNKALDSTDPDMLARIHWLEGMLFYYTGDTEPTVNCLESMLNEEWFQNLEVVLPNILHHYSINELYVSNILKSLNINKNLTRVIELYQGEGYDDVIEILSDSLLSDQLVTDSGPDFTLSRPRQFSLIIDSLWKLSKFKECFYWSEFFLFDSLTEYKNSTDEDERSTNASYIVTLMEGILSIFNTVGNIIFKTLPPDRQSRIVQTLSSIICLQMDVPETTTEMTIESISPWLLLHHIIKFDEEFKEKNMDRLHNSGVRNEEDTLPVSLSILHQAHDYLGRRGWCCFNEGSLLFFSLEIMYPLFSSLNPESKALFLINQEIDQIFYCLYGQQKKAKGRHINNHNTFGLALTWTRAQQVFRFTKPKELPSYDSGGKCSINSETEATYLKLISCVPPESDPSRLVPEMTKYVEGEADDIPQNICLLPEDFSNIYYLIAHYYFRNKYWTKALKFYLMDVCANPSRVDSWACLALARGSLIETKINSCDVIKNENYVLKNAGMVSRCFDRSLRLDPMQSTLWIEKGSFSYMIHSFCSNLLKKELNLSLEMFDVLENKKDTLLSSAMDAFSKANKIWYSCNGLEIQDERWLLHYMMGKISEKKGDEPQVFIDHYLKASELLHNMGALYPSCICYASPQRLAVESLEMYYRIHASALKFLEKNEGKEVHQTNLLIFKRAITKLSKSPFIVHCQTVKDDAPKNEPLIKDKTDEKSDDPYSPGDNTTDCLSNPGGHLPTTVKTSEAKSDVSIPQELSTLKTEFPQPDHNTSISMNLEKKQTPSFSVQNASAPTKKMVTDSNVENSAFQLKSDQKVSSKENEGTKRRSSLEIELPSTNDSVSKPSGIEKQVKTSESSSDDSSSSDSTSSSDSSSSSESSSSSSDQESESNHEQVTPPEEQPIDWEMECDSLTKQCLQAMENCTGRFQEHFKSLYHLAYFYFKSKNKKDLSKVKTILLESGGLFAERKNSNFFNGIWKIPNHEIDRPGNFAAHMGRCTQLLLEYLKETRDYKMLIDLALFLKVVPEPDKKYLRDTEREELCHEALSLAAISLRKKLAEVSKENLHKSFLSDVFSIYRKISKSCLKEPVFTAILSESFLKLTGQKIENNLEAEVHQYLKKEQQPPPVQQQIVQPIAAISKSAVEKGVVAGSITIEPIPLTVTPTPPVLPVPSPNLPVAVSASAVTISPPIIQPPPLASVLDLQTKNVSSTKSTPVNSRGRSGVTKRPRGRPPGSTNQPLRHSISAILQPRSDIFRAVDPFRPKLRPSLSITPVPPRPRKPKPQSKPPIPHSLPASISITSVSTQQRPFSYQSISITPRPRQPLSEPRLPPASIIPISVPQSQSKFSRPHPTPPPAHSGPSPPKIPHLEFNVAQAIRNLGNTITITPSPGEPPKSKPSPNIPTKSKPLPTTSHPPPAHINPPATQQKSDPNIQVIILDD